MLTVLIEMEGLVLMVTVLMTTMTSTTEWVHAASNCAKGFISHLMLKKHSVWAPIQNPLNQIFKDEGQEMYAF